MTNAGLKITCEEKNKTFFLVLKKEISDSTSIVLDKLKVIIAWLKKCVKLHFES